MVAQFTAARDEDVRTFELPLMEGMVVTDSGPVPNSKIPTAQSLEALHKQAYEEGFELGRTEGIASGEEEIQTKLAHLNALLGTLAEPFIELDESVVRSTAELAIVIAQHLVRRELKANPGEVVAVTRDAIGQLPVAARNPRVRMHPEDIEIVETSLRIGDEPRAWVMQPDPLMTRGGCVVETDASRVDASVESRMSAIVAQMFGGDREGDQLE